MEPTPMRIVKLEASNVKRLVAVEITPDGNVIVIGGRNGAGKSSVLDSIAYALGGKDLVCERPLRAGADRGHVEVDLGDLVVRRTFTPSGGGSLTVSNKEGAVYKSPQAMLDKLVGRLSFDPLDFERMEAKRQLETLRALVGIDFSGIDAARAELYDERTAVNRTTKQLEARLATLPEYPWEGGRSLTSLLCRLLGHRWCNGDEVDPRWCERCGLVRPQIHPDDETERDDLESPEALY